MKKYEIVITPEIHDAIIAEGLKLFYPVDGTSLIGRHFYYSDGLGMRFLLWNYPLPSYGMCFPLFNKRSYHDRFTEMMKRSFPEALL